MLVLFDLGPASSDSLLQVDLRSDPYPRSTPFQTRTPTGRQSRSVSRRGPRRDVTVDHGLASRDPWNFFAAATIHSSQRRDCTPPSPPQKGTERILPMASDAAARGRTPQRHGGGRAHAGSTMFGRADVEWLADVGGGGDLAS